MSNIVPLRATGALTRQDPRRLQLFVKTVGKELRGSEIDEALEWCQLYGANPFVKDIYFFVFDADDANKRRVVPVLGIGLYRKIAARAGNYRPDDEAPRFAYDESARSPANPTGMIWCEVSVYRHSHGAWHPIKSRLKWEERAPIILDGSDGFEWEETGDVYPQGHAKAGKKKYRKKLLGSKVETLDPNKKNWRTMPETMLAKCCEADAIRKGWPSETAGSYVHEEMDALQTIDLTATEIVEKVEQAERLEKIGGPALIVDWCDGKPMERVAVGKFGDRALSFIAAAVAESPSLVAAWADRNRYVLQEYWALDKAGALEVKKAIEHAATVQPEAAE